MLESFHFLRPWWLAALIPAAALMAFIWNSQSGRRAWAALIAPHLLSRLMVGADVRRRIRPVSVLGMTWCIGIIALAGPTWRLEDSPFTEDEAALVIVLRVHPTMLARDIQPTRLERSAQKVGDLLELRPGAKTALIAYSGSAHLVLPLTNDGRIIDQFAAELTPDIMPSEGDAAAGALQLAADTLSDANVPGSILMITDSPPASDSNETGIPYPVHLLAVAAPADVPVPADSPPAPPLDQRGFEQAAVQLGGTSTVITPDQGDVTSLARIAETQFRSVEAEGGGQHWRDSGYWLVPLLVGCCLLWSRRGWTVVYS